VSLELPLSHLSATRAGQARAGRKSWRPLHAVAALLVVGTLFVAGCEDSGLQPTVDPPMVAGSWSGTLTMSGQSFAADFNLTQNGTDVGGTASIQSLLAPSPIEAAIDGAGRVIMLIESGCESWFAQMSVTGDEQRMSGPVQVDRQACPTGLDDGGTLSLDRN
jgi:hypothetical protein